MDSVSVLVIFGAIGLYILLYNWWDLIRYGLGLDPHGQPRAYHQ